MIKVIAIDFVGVLVKEKHIQLEETEEKLERKFGDNINDTDYLEEAKKLTNENIIDITHNIFDKLYNPIDKEIFSKLKESIKNVSFLIATNHVSYIKDYIKKTFNNVDDIIISAEIGKIKPNRDFYEYILNKYHIKPEELLFLDDNINNIEGASILGINTIKVNKDTNIYKEILDKVTI